MRPKSQRYSAPGPYHQWTRKIDGKTVTRRLSDEQAADYGPWFANPIKPFSDDDEALAWANRGLVAYLYTRDLMILNRAVRFMEGTMGVNQGMVSNRGRPLRWREAVRLRP